MSNAVAANLSEEWLVADQRGGFAMGTAGGVRTRKYHGFYLGIAGRAETAFLADLELKLNGRDLWPHRYQGWDGPVVHPEPLEAATAFAFERFRGLPRWRWELEGGELVFGLEPESRGGIRLSWKWLEARRKAPARLEVRPFWALRPLHGLGGQSWRLETRPDGTALIAGASGQETFCRLEGAFEWIEDPQWYRCFHYTEEQARGYDSQEDLYSAGYFVADLAASGRSASWHLADSPLAFCDPAAAVAAPRAASRARARAPALDFVLHEPEGVVAGFPWFGEWGRDTFVSLPGIAMGWLRAGGDPVEVRSWVEAVLARWGEWIRLTGMIPNVIEKGGAPQWESSDGTLWWCHALAALWSFSLDGGRVFEGLDKKFVELLSIAVASIESGRHRHLRPAADGLLEVTGPRSTWMDAQLEGQAVTPRTGALPEINALWFQARCLQWLWSPGRATERESAEAIERLGRAALACREPDRPNLVFLHSIPLAPSFVVRDTEILRTQLREVAELLWTPVGLRTLSPRNPAYHPRCAGPQATRDLAYHRGPPWPWLGGHYAMARLRCVRKSGLPEIRHAHGEMRGPIEGHIPELFDAEPPFLARGAPAQAWSAACFEEAAARRQGRVDARLTEVLAQRSLDRLQKSEELSIR